MSAQEAVRETALVPVQDTTTQTPLAAPVRVAPYGAFTSGLIVAGMVVGVPAMMSRGLREVLTGGLAGLTGEGTKSLLVVPLALAAAAWAIHRRAGWAPLKAIFTARLAPRGQGRRFALGCLVQTAAIAWILIDSGGR